MVTLTATLVIVEIDKGQLVAVRITNIGCVESRSVLRSGARRAFVSTSVLKREFKESPY